MNVDMTLTCEDSQIKNLVPGQSFLHGGEIYIALNRTDLGYLVRKIDSDQGIEMVKNEKIYIVKSLKNRSFPGGL
tara:strand:+ start:37 stop:261 length:225 start_codon:yes stop_codon:yes gene_type:complete